MKRFLSLFLIMTLCLVVGSVSVFAAGSVVAELKGSDKGAFQVDTTLYEPAQKEGDVLVLGNQGDFAGYVFKDVEPGVYKLGLYVDLEELGSSGQIRLNPKVKDSTGKNGERKCWIDFPVDSEINGEANPIVAAYEGASGSKVVLVGVFTVPEGYDTVECGFWVDGSSYVGKLEKVVLATSDYNMVESGYTLLKEDSYGDAKFNEDPDQKLLAADGDWVASGKATEDPKGEDPTEKPTEKPKTEEPAKTGDASMLVTLIVAASAAIGGFKAKKK